MDVRQMEFEGSQFDIIIDKGCQDCLFCGENSFQSSQLALNEIYRVLKQKGIYIDISNTLVDYRLPFYQKLKWEIQTFKIPKPEIIDSVYDKEISNYYSLFICKKDL